MVFQLFVHYKWKDVKEILEKHLQGMLVINLFMADKALLNVEESVIQKRLMENGEVLGTCI